MEAKIFLKAVNTSKRVYKFLMRTASATSPEEVIAGYNEWAPTYEEDFDEIGTQDSVIAEEVAFILGKNKHARILDLAAGTGTVGQMLYEKGYTNLDAIDASQEMLNVAKTKNVYKNLMCEFVDKKQLPIEAETYDMIVGLGCLADSHVSSHSFVELIRITKTGGFLIFLTALLWFDNDKYEARINSLASLNYWTRIYTKYIPKYWGDEMGISYVLQKR